MSEEIREKIEAARTKEQLEEIGRNLSTPIELDRRKNMDILQAELHGHLDQIESGTDQTQGAGATGDDGSAPEQGDDQEVVAKNLRPDPEPEPETQTVTSHSNRTNYKGRLLQNTKTKVFFPWTAALAAKRNMREV